MAEVRAYASTGTATVAANRQYMALPNASGTWWVRARVVHGLDSGGTWREVGVSVPPPTNPSFGNVTGSGVTVNFTKGAFEADISLDVTQNSSTSITVGITTNAVCKSARVLMRQANTVADGEAGNWGSWTTTSYNKTSLSGDTRYTFTHTQALDTAVQFLVIAYPGTNLDGTYIGFSSFTGWNFNSSGTGTELKVHVEG